MPYISYQIQAQVVDLKTDNPRQADRFLVDTNVWIITSFRSPFDAQFLPGDSQPRGFETHPPPAKNVF